MNQTETLAERAAERDAGKTRGGDGILAGQKMHPAFTKVNASWIAKTLTFEQLLKEAREYQRHFRDFDGLRLAGLKPEGGRLDVGGLRVALTGHSARQFGAAVGVPGFYLRQLAKGAPEDVALFDANVSRALARLVEEPQQQDDEGQEAPRDKEVFLRVRDGASPILRAILSSRYAVINNLPIIETLGEALPGSRVSHLHYDGDTLRANVLVPDTLRQEPDSDYGGGVSVLNNEIGQFTLGVRPFVFRAICCNGNIWDRLDGSEFRRRHIGSVDWNELRRNVILNIQRQIPLVTERIEKVLALKGLPLTEQQIQQAIVYLGRREELPKSAAQSWYAGVKDELAEAKTAQDILSAFGVVQGLTRAAQKQTFEVQELMETLSARLVDANWEKVLTAATAETTPEKALEVLTPKAA